MNMNFLDFEQPIAELEAKIQELRSLGSDSEINIDKEITNLEKKNHQLTKSIFAKLTPMQIVQLARHPQRPHTIDYINHLFTDFDELSGDRHYGKGASIVAGIARFDNRPVIVMGHEKGRKTKEKLSRNFGMPSPEDYRKTLRLMEMAEKFKLPVMTLIDTPGAYPGVKAEQHNQSWAIARNLYAMAQLKTPIISVVVGEGGSGGALALGVADQIFMLQYSIYSVISPEGCASILWKSAEKASDAADALGITADRIKKFGLIDNVIEEPLGGAHRDIDKTMQQVKIMLTSALTELTPLTIEELLARRQQRLFNRHDS
ncbi:MAG: acetyl-CoA carboxylase carboxyltransferase subunit alpha [Gammaproteobacteria bacterium]|nr:acetyl-CoA carboxylase carboxyltransferase subunit alpha [Gammaproteobacteria bacterium]